MKIQGFVLLAIFLNICRTGYSLAIPQNGSNSSWQRVFGGYYIPRNSNYKQLFTVSVAYYVSIEDQWPVQVCSGSIITTEYIVSTAQCLENMGLTRDRFLITITGRKGTVFRRSLTRIVLHEEFGQGLENNIGLGKVNEPYDFSTGELLPVKLPDSSWGPLEFEGEPLTVCGHRDPYTTQYGSEFQPTCFIFTPRERDYCIGDQSINLEDNEICASSSDMTKYSVCLQDYGAGLIYVRKTLPIIGPYEFYLYAIASEHEGDYFSCAEKPTTFLVVSGFLQWIATNMD